MLLHPCLGWRFVVALGMAACSTSCSSTVHEGCGVGLGLRVVLEAAAGRRVSAVMLKIVACSGAGTKHG